MSGATARTHVSRVMAKLGARDRAQLVVIAYESGLLTPGADAVPPAPLLNCADPAQIGWIGGCTQHRRPESPARVPRVAFFGSMLSSPTLGSVVGMTTWSE